MLLRFSSNPTVLKREKNRRRKVFAVFVVQGAQSLNNLFSRAREDNLAVRPLGQIPCKNGNMFYKSIQYNSKIGNARLML